MVNIRELQCEIRLVLGYIYVCVGGGGAAWLPWKKGYCSVCEAVGRCWGSYFIRSCMRARPGGVITVIVVIVIWLVS